MISDESKDTLANFQTDYFRGVLQEAQAAIIRQSREMSGLE